MLTVTGIDHLVINVNDPDKSARWYERVLGMRREQAHGREILYFGQEKINLRPVGFSKQEWWTADHEAAGSQDLCFLVGTSAEAIVEHLGACGVAVQLGPLARDGARGKMTSVYCRDPDGSLIEIATYGAN
jgi:catechol 2,3-dioxygenase-like lactoylglutathione lyase family enzyme